MSTVPKLEPQWVPEYQIIKEVGRGGYGRVYLAIKDNEPYAIKVIKVHKDEDIILREIIILHYLSQPKCRLNILCFIDAKKVEPKNIYILITKYMSGGELGDYIYNTYYSYMEHNRKLYYKVLYKYFYQMVDAVNEIHKLGIAHNDIKPSNFLVNNDKVYLSDFGLACPLTEELAKKLNIKMCSILGGTKQFMAPQLYKNKVKDFKKVDIYALGVTYYYLLYFEFPFYDNNLDVGLMELDPFLDKRVKVLIYEMLNSNPDERPTTKEILETFHSLINT